MAKKLLLPFYREDWLEAGVDEAGRGCLAGPVVAAAVVWNPRVDAPEVREIRDSKRLARGVRARLREFIEAHAVAHSLCFVDNAVIDASGILHATMDAMHGALDGLGVAVDAALVDGPYFAARGRALTPVCVVNGDDRYLSIAAASILAKEHRDEFMRAASAACGDAYSWSRNMGYGTPAHLAALAARGPSPLHRLSFRPLAPPGPAEPPEEGGPCQKSTGAREGEPTPQ